LEEQKIDSVLLPALNFMRIDTNGEPDNYYIKENLNRELEKHSDKKLFITQGYICRNLYGEIDNLKRGGSDYSASLIGAAIEAEEIQIWTDISGFHNNDPRYVENTHPIERLSFDEAAELAYFGAKILHPSSVQPAKLANIPVRLKNTMKPGDPGTLISGEANGKGIKAVAAKDGITAIKIKSGRMLLAYGFLRKVFEVFERFKTPIDMITTSEVAVSVTIDDTTYLAELTEELKYYGAVEVDSDQTIICVVGENLIEQKGIINKVFEALQHFNIRMISYGGSRHSISILVSANDKKDALNSLNGMF
jgi:aspartate kinase